MQKILKSKHQIRFQDCDPLRHLNNAKYLDYFLNAREDQISDHYGIQIFGGFSSNATSWVVGSSQIHYHRPAQLMENVVIESQVIRFGAKFIQIEMKMWDEAETQLKAFLWTSLIHVNIKSGKPHPHSEELLSLFKSVLAPVPERTFESRRNAIMQGLTMADSLAP